MRDFDTRRTIKIAVVLTASAFLNSCGNGGPATPPPFQGPEGTAYVFIGDAPSPGSSVLNFEITLNSAVLCPQVGLGGECQGLPQVELLSAPVEIELKQLELGTAFLSLQSVQTGTYSGVKLTFANPELKLLRADGSIQELDSPGLTLDPSTATPTISGAVTVAADSNVGLLIDFNLLDSIQSSGSEVTGISPVVNVVKLVATGEQSLARLEDATGRVSSLTKTCPSGSYTLVDSLTGLLVASVQFDGTTEFEDLTCETLANDQIVESDIELRSASGQSAQFFAEEIELVNPADEGGMEGLVFQVNSTTQFVLLVHQQENLGNVAAGGLVTVDIDPDRTGFSVDADALPFESSQFDSAADLIVGQKLEVDVVEGSFVGSPNGCATLDDDCTADAEKLRLKKGTVTARVASVSGANFALDQLPSLFGSVSVFRPISAGCSACFVGSIQVTTSSQTQFEDGLTGIADLQIGNVVTVRGLFIKDGFTGPGPVPTASPQLVAQKVRRRTD